MTIEKDTIDVLGFVHQLDPNIKITEAQKKIFAAATTVKAPKRESPKELTGTHEERLIVIFDDLI